MAGEVRVRRSNPRAACITERVLRGGAWATEPDAARGTFRNWHCPFRRQIFAGFRCARDA
ncbi:MAG TPA: SUMF1/EgtB/PvdO family nonheme iron enzyme [Longimicrobiales bacterium]|nr:SUMF1/EgtB/PvdO family nonheme iron enzyme [Longimicrobiales bacterium]